MPEPILDPSYWKGRLGAAVEVHHSIFKCPKDQWDRIAARHQLILANRIGPRQSVFDVGCGYGRLLSLMPVGWNGDYIGVDLSPDMIKIADEMYPDREFWIHDLSKPSRELTPRNWLYDWAVLISIRPMVKRNCGNEVWERMESNVRRWANQLLYLEYDEFDEGSVE